MWHLRINKPIVRPSLSPIRSCLYAHLVQTINIHIIKIFYKSGRISTVTSPIFIFLPLLFISNIFVHSIVALCPLSTKLIPQRFSCHSMHNECCGCAGMRVADEGQFWWMRHIECIVSTLIIKIVQPFFSADIDFLSD